MKKRLALSGKERLESAVLHKNKAAQELGRKGGFARAKALSPEQRQAISRLGNQAKAKRKQIRRQL